MKTGLYSFIDYGRQDFLRNPNGSVVKIEADYQEEAEDWLMDNGEKYGWSNDGVKYLNWNED